MVDQDEAGQFREARKGNADHTELDLCTFNKRGFEVCSDEVDGTFSRWKQHNLQDPSHGGALDHIA